MVCTTWWVMYMNGSPIGTPKPITTKGLHSIRQGRKMVNTAVYVVVHSRLRRCRSDPQSVILMSSWITDVISVFAVSCPAAADCTILSTGGFHSHGCSGFLQWM